MVKKIISVLVIVIPLVIRAQVNVSVQLPAAGLIQKDQLWNLVLVNNDKESFDVTVMMNLQDVSTGQTILSGTSRSFILPRGVKSINIKDVDPVQYNYGLSGFNATYLPPGAYIACYTLTKRRLDAIETIAAECGNINIAPLSPPVLNSPADRSILQTTYPQFTWSPPTPLQMFDNLNYEITVSEIMEGQSPMDAIRYNTPVYAKTNGKQTFEIYPSTYAKLDTTKTYAWQVVARSGLNYAAATEIWSFSFQKDSAEIKNTSSSYILLKGNGDEGGVYYIDGSDLLVKYYSFDREHETTVRFFNAKGQLLKQKKQKIIYGDNFIRFELNNQFQQGQVYRIEVTDLQNRIHAASFSIKQTN